MALTVVILSAGKGSRMRSDTPKVLHPLAGKPLAAHVVDAARQLAPRQIRLVYGHGAEAVKTALAQYRLHWCLQAEQHGTGHAVNQAMPGIPDDDIVLVLYGDVPLVAADTLRRLVGLAGGDSLGLLTVRRANPAGYGRIVRKDGVVQRIVEQQDATPEQRTITEVNTGLLAARAVDLKRWLAGLGNDNAQGEYYLTDVIAMAVAEGLAVKTVITDAEHEVAGVNDKIQLAALERTFQRLQAEALMRAGVQLADPARLDCRMAQIRHGVDCRIDANVIIEGEVTLGDRVAIGANVILKDCVIGSDSEILPYSLVEGGVVGENARVGPYARLRPGAQLADRVRIGNFVEVKQASIAEDAKVNHLTYIGDARIGRRVNVGAGVITCNYDGANKHLTEIGDDAFIGSNTALVAPISVGDNATVGAGSTLSREVPADGLTVTRAPVERVDHWRRPQKKTS